MKVTIFVKNDGKGQYVSYAKNEDEQIVTEKSYGSSHIDSAMKGIEEAKKQKHNIVGVRMEKKDLQALYYDIAEYYQTKCHLTESVYLAFGSLKWYDLIFPTKRYKIYLEQVSKLAKFKENNQNPLFNINK